MKKIILSVAVATMALSTAAAALEDIKVNGQAKVWYETANTGPTNEMFSKNQTATSGEVVFKIGVTGKQGNVGFGATVYQTSAMGLEETLVGKVRNSGATGFTGDGEMYTGEMYITLPVGAKTLLKMGKQELDTPLAFTERWDAVPNTFDAAVAINNSIDNLTLIGAYVGEASTGEFDSQAFSPLGVQATSVYAMAGLYKANGLAVNAWYYDMNSIGSAYWLDAGTKLAGFDVKAYLAYIDPTANIDPESTTAYALSASTTVSGIKLFVAGAKVSDKGYVPVGNVATGSKKTKLPTAGVYTDGKYISQPGSKSLKIKASGKLGTTGVALQLVDNSNGLTGNHLAGMGSTGSTGANNTLETTEIDLILTQKVGDVNLKAILMDRSFDNGTEDSRVGGQHVRVIASVDF